MRINFRFLGLLVVVLLLLGGIVFVVHRVQASRSAGLLLSQAREAKEANELGKAIGFYNRYLGMNPQSAEAEAELGSLLVDVGQYEGAYFHLESAVRSRPDDLELRKQLTIASLGIERIADAKANLQEYLLKADEKNTEYLGLLAVCEQRLGNFDEALQILEGAHSVDPSDTRTTSGLINLYSGRFARHSDAQRALDETVAAAPTNPAGYLLRGGWALTRATSATARSEKEQLLQTASNDARQAQELDPKDQRGALLLAEVAVARGNTEEARDVISGVIDAYPNLAQLYAMAAQIELRVSEEAVPDNRLQSAMAWLKKGLQQVPGDLTLLRDLTLCELDADNLEEAEKLIEDLRKREYPESGIEYLQIRLKMAGGKWQDAANQIEQASLTLSRSDKLVKEYDLLLAECYRELGNPEEEIAILRRALSIDPLWPPARQALSLALQRAGRLEDAKAELERLLAQPNPPADAVLRFVKMELIEGLNSEAPSRVSR